MPTSRTGTASHQHFRTAVLTRGQEQGTTHCPCTDPHKHHPNRTPCGVWLDYENSRQPNSAEPDHIIPVARGGTDHPDNGRVLCRQCNQARGNGLRTKATAKKPKQPITTGYSW